MAVKSISGTGSAELDEVIEDHAGAILELQRAIGLDTSYMGPAGCLIVVVDGDGVPAATDDDTPGVGRGMLRVVYGDGLLRDSGRYVRLLNIARGVDGGIAAGKQVATMPILNKPGYNLIVLDPCPPV